MLRILTLRLIILKFDFAIIANFLIAIIIAVETVITVTGRCGVSIMYAVKKNAGCLNILTRKNGRQKKGGFNRKLAANTLPF